jgi:hypothetical protein
MIPPEINDESWDNLHNSVGACVLDRVDLPAVTTKVHPVPSYK